MTARKRRLNFTKRERIKQEDITVTLQKGATGGPPAFALELDFSRYDFPSDALIVVEAYRGSSLMRFECGTISKKTIPEKMVLDEIENDGNVLFRIKVVDQSGIRGRILGMATKISANSGGENEGKQSLLSIVWSDLGPEIWRVSMDDDLRPALCLNYKAGGLQGRIHDDPLVRGIILPAAFRIVLEKLTTSLLVDEDDSGDWKEQWLEFCDKKLGQKIDPQELEEDEEAREAWINETVQEFCINANFMGLIATAAARE